MPKFVPPAKLGIIGKRGLINPLPRPLGTELEIGDWGSLEGRRFEHLRYTKGYDWSVKPSEHEMVISPLVGDAFIEGMLELAEELFDSGATVNDTCALHVHVGATDFGYWDIRRLLEVYSRIEPDVYRYLVAPYRSAKPECVHYCQLLTVPHDTCPRCERYDEQHPGARQPLEPLSRVLARMALAKDTSDLKVALFRMLYNIDDPSTAPRDLQHRKGGKYEWCRYRGLNLHSWLHRGTVEWRMKEAVTDVSELVFYPLFCGYVVHAITAMSDTEARSDRMNMLYLAERYMPKYLAAWVRTKMGLSTGA